MPLLSSWDDMDVPVKLLADYAWAAEDDKTGFLKVNYTCKYDQYPWPWCKLVPKHKNMINEDNGESWTIEKMRFVFNKW